MSGIYGSWASRRDNIVELGILNSVSATDSVEVSGTRYTFVHIINGTNVRTTDEGSLDGTNWFALDDEKTHQSSGTYAASYNNLVLRFIRTSCTSIGAGQTVSAWVAVD